MSGFLTTGALLEDTGAHTASAEPIVLTPQSATIHHLSGDGVVGTEQVVRLPDATKLQPGVRYFVANRSSVAAEIQRSTTESLTKVDPGFHAEFRLLSSSDSAGTWYSAIFPSVEAQTQGMNLAFIGQATWTWQGSKLSTDGDVFIHVPGLKSEINRIPKFPDYGSLDLTLVDDVAGSLSGKYVFLNNPSNAGHYFYFVVGGVGSDPGPFAGRTGYAVNVASGASGSEVAQGLAAAINTELSSSYTASASGSVVTVVNKRFGRITAPTVSSGFTVALSNPGQNEVELASEGAVAYVHIRRSAFQAPAGEPLTVYTAPSMEVLDASNPDLRILAKNLGSGCVFVADSVRLLDGQSEQLVSSGGAKGEPGAVQYNAGGFFAGGADLVWVAATQTLKLGDLALRCLSQNVTLLDAQTTAQTIETFDPVAFQNLIVEYSLNRNGKFQTGQMLIVNDGVDAGISDNFVAVSSLGVEFIAGINDDGQLVLAYQTSATGHNATFRYSLRYWA